MFAINIDISELTNSLTFTKEETEDFARMVLDTVSDVYMQKWEKIVDTNLKSTRRSYKLGMDSRRITDFHTQFVLEGKGDSKLGMMIEEGASAFDIKEGMFKSSKKKQTKDGGWYITVPFRQATPETIGESSVFSGQTSKDEAVREVFKTAKGNAGSPVTREQLPSDLQSIETRAAIKNNEVTIAAYEHKTPIYQGLVKSTKPKHEGYYTFRRISDKSDELSWIHKGFTPHKFMEKALQEMEQELPEVLKYAKEAFLNAKYA